MRRQCLAAALGAAIVLTVLSMPSGDDRDLPLAHGSPMVSPSSGGPSPTYVTRYPWPMQRYNVTHSGMTRSPSPETNSVLWSSSTGDMVISSPAIADGKVFIGTGSGSGDAMYAFYQDNGTLAWMTPLDNPVSGGMGLTSSPAYSNGMLFYGGDKIYGVYANNGTIKWRVETGNMNWGDGTPTVHQGKVYIGGSDWYLYKIDQLSGTVEWRFGPLWTQPAGNGNYGLYSAPAISGNYAYLAACDGYVYQIDINQPGPTATYTRRSLRYATMYGSVTIYNGMVLVGDGYYAPTSVNNRFRALSTTDLSLVWAFNPGRSTAFFSSAAVAYNTVYFGDVAGYLYAVYPNNGTRKWEYRIGSTIWSSPAISDGKLFIGSKNGNLYSFNANQTGTPTTRWSYPTGGEVDSAPAISDGAVCVGSRSGTVVCLGASTPPIDQRPTVNAWEPGGTAGQSYLIGTSINVRWLATDDNPMPVNNINISYGSGSSWTDIVRNTQNDGAFLWGTTGVPAGNYYINVTAFDSKGQWSWDIGNYTFQMGTPPDPKPTVIAWEPGGTSGQSYTVGQAVQVRWLATDDKAMPADNINISYGGGASWSDVVRNTQNDGAFSWDTTGVTPGSYYINVTAYDSIGQLSWDIANYSFQVVSPVNQPPSTTITQPAGGESWTGGSVHNVAFTANDAEDPPSSLLVWVNYSLTGGTPFNLQVAGLQGVPSTSSPYAWTLPTVDSITVVLNSTVMDTDGAKGYAVSPPFEIDSTAPWVSFTNPSSGAGGVPTNANVLTTWSELMNTGSAELSFSLADTVTWTPVVGTFSWAGTTMTFNPTAMLASGTQYSANITATASDDSSPGNYIATPYVWLFTTSASSDTIAPTLSGVTVVQNPQECSLPVNVSVLIQDNVGVGEAWLNMTSPIGDAGNFTMLFDSSSGRYFRLRVCGTLGLHTFTIWAADASGNWNFTSGQFDVVDTTKPSITDLRALPNPDEVLFTANVSAIVADGCQLSEVWLSVTAPDASTWNLSMIAGPRYYREILPDQIGTYGLRIWASDLDGNLQTAFSQLVVRDTTPPIVHTYAALPNPAEVFSSVDISATVTDNFLLSSVHVNVTRPDSTWTNDSMTGVPPAFSSLFATDMIGAHSFTISANDSSDNWAKASGSFLVVDTVSPAIEHTPVATWLTGLALNVTANVTDNYLVDEARLDYIDVDGARHNMTMTHGTANAYHFVIGGQPHSGTLTYFLWANDSSGNEVRTQSYLVSVVGSPPNPPTGLTVTPDGRGTLVLHWTAPTKNVDGSDLTDLEGYIVFRMNVSNGDRYRVRANLVQGTQLADSGLRDTTTYYYVVRAVNSSSVESADSNEASGTTPAPTEPGGEAFPIISVVIVVVFVVVAAFLIVFFLLMRKKKRKGDQEELSGSFKAPAEERQPEGPGRKDR